MPTKLQEYTQMAEYAENQILHDYKQWTSFLETASRLYKYSFPEQLMIYAQKPDATACASYGIWNNNMKRYIRRGAKGIALVDETQTKPEIRYVFDIADTGVRRQSRTPYLWSYQSEQHKPAVTSALRQKYGLPEDMELSPMIEQIASKLSEEYWNDNEYDLLYSLEGSFLEEYDDFNVSIQFQRAAAASIAYMTLSRCGLEPELDFDYQDFAGVFECNTPQTITALGTVISKASEEMLREIEVTIKKYERERNAEHGRDNIPPRGGVSSPQHNPSGGQHTSFGEVRNDAESISQGASPDPVQSAPAVREAVFGDGGGRQGGERETGAYDAGNDEIHERDREAQSPGIHEVGGADEQHQITDRGDDSGGTGVQLNIFGDKPEAIDFDTASISDPVPESPAEAESPDVSIDKPTVSEPISLPKAENFRITDDMLGVGTSAEKFQRNMEAIHTLKNIEAQGRDATVQEQETLSKYVGWGGLSSSFEESSPQYQELHDLLTDEEFSDARASVINAHYTSPVIIKAMYDAVEKMGFKSGNILDPACGVGNFYGLLPESMNESRLYGTELDSISGRIAGLLYPDAAIQVAGFETTARQNFYDLAIGNVPFGQYQVFDPKYNHLKFNIHDYFFAKTLDQVRPGGIVAFVTSRFTMDKKSPEVRRYLAQRADLLGAVRLPDNAFKANAGTEITTDILFLQKRERPLEIDPDWVHLDRTEDGIAINSYFTDHPEMILGTMEMKSTRYGMSPSCKPIEGADLSQQLAKAVSGIEGAFTEIEPPELEDDDVSNVTIPADPNVKNFSYTVVDDEVYYRENSVMIRQELNATAKERVKGMAELRDCVRTLVDQQMQEAPDNIVKQSQENLHSLYDNYTKKYGQINSQANRLAFSEDNAYYLLCALENLDDKGSFVSKADIFYKRTVSPHKIISHAETSADALALSISECGCIDMGFMSQLSGKDIDTLAKELEGVIFRLPNSPEQNPVYVTADEYLSGNVRNKLMTAKEAAENDSTLKINVTALEKVKPRELDATEIDVRLGATWIPTEYIQQFMYETFETPGYMKNDMTVSFSSYTADWNISHKNYARNNDVKANAIYGTGRMNAYHILEDTLNLRDVRVYDKITDSDNKTKRVLNQEQTMLAQQKQQAVKDAFGDWVFKDPDRRHALVKMYNEKFNSIRPREYDGSHLTFVGMNPEITLMPHQKTAIAREIYGGNTLLAHEVGAGKTFEMIAAAMEGKRLGLCNKSLFAVPNHLTEQWGTEFMRLYPNANVLVVRKKDFQTANRKRFTARIATGDYDAVIMGFSQFERVPVSQKRQEKYINDQISEIESGISELKAHNAERYTIKQMELTRNKLDTKLKKLLESPKDDVVVFEELGVDRLFVDEAQHYKNLFLYTKMRNVAGLSATEAQKSSDMFLKCRYMDEKTEGRGVVFATGTPVSNSMTEMYTMQRYLQHKALEEHGLIHFDSWASTFGETTTAIELSPEGTGYRARTRFAKFHNLPELMNVFKEVADIKTADELSLPRPEAVFTTVVAKPTEHQKAMVKELSERASRVHSGAVDPSEDNMLCITNDGRKLGLDQRLLNPLLPDDPGSKVNMCVANIQKIYKDGQDEKLTQLVFCDLSTPKNKGEFTIYEDIRNKLVAGGIPKEEVAFIHEANSEVQKKELFAKVRSGSVRVLMGSTQKCGAGMNVQDRLIASHDLDCPWRPGDLTQRAGRTIRQGNKNDKVSIYRYVTEGTFDSYLWQTVEKKQTFISQIMTSKTPVRSCEDVDDATLSYAEIKSLCAGNPLISEKMNLDIEVAKLKVLKSGYQRTQYHLQDRVKVELPSEINKNHNRAEIMKQDLDKLQGYSEFCMQVNDKSYTDKTEAGEAILKACKEIKPDEPVKIGSFCGMDVTLHYASFIKDFRLSIQGLLPYSVSLGTDPRGNITRIENVLKDIPEKIKNAEDKARQLANQLELSKAELSKPFAQEQELKTKSERLTELNTLLSLDEKKSNIGSQESTSHEVKKENERASGNAPKGSVLKRLGKFRNEVQTGQKPINSSKERAMR